MRVLVLTGIKEELIGLLSAGFQWDPDMRLHRSLQQPELFAATTGPGLRGRKQLRGALRRLRPDVVVNGGLVGALKEDDRPDRLRVGDRLALGEVIDAKSGIIYPGGRGRARLVSVERPVFAPLEKMNLHLDTRAGVCDMEAAPLLHMMGELTLAGDLGEVFTVFCKVVGDLPEDHSLFKREELVRGWHGKSGRQKVEVFLKRPLDAMVLFKLFQRKRRALESLTVRLGGVIRRLYRTGRVDEEMDSVFIPH